jgi:hypothetical protein
MAERAGFEHPTPRAQLSFQRNDRKKLSLQSQRIMAVSRNSALILRTSDASVYGLKDRRICGAMRVIAFDRLQPLAILKSRRSIETT